MDWLRRVMDRQRASGMSKATEDCLTQAGWKAGRQCDLTPVEEAFGSAGFLLHDAARGFLAEYYDLAIEAPITGITDISGFVHFVPQNVLRFMEPSNLEWLHLLMPESACPVGTTSGHTCFIFMDAAGKSYLLDMEWSLFGPLAASPSEMLEILCDGRNGRVDSRIIGEDGRLTGRVIEAGDERRHWNLDQFPHMAPFLPEISLSPLRRPPTQRPLVRTAEKALAGGVKPSSLLVTSGGFAHAPSGQTYFVAHCENSVYIRRRAEFRVSPPPAGIPRRVRVGECFPYDPPKSPEE